MKNKRALITGASSERDMGTAICRSLASKGINVFFTHWKAETNWPARFQRELAEMGVESGSMEIDLSLADAASHVLDRMDSTFGFPAILVNNAAHSVRDGYRAFDAKTMDDHYAVNMRSTFLLCTEFARRFEERDIEAGRIINMTSGQELGPMPGELAYAATKAAISAFTKTLSQELASLGITVNAVNPGPTDSTWMTDEVKDHLLTKFPMGRIGLPEDAARTIAFLASDDAKWITGQLIHSEGGFFRS